MNLRSLTSALCVVVPLTLNGADGAAPSPGPKDANPESIAPPNISQPWLHSFDFSHQQLEADYRGSIAGGVAPERPIPFTPEAPPNFVEAERLIPIVFLAPAEAGEKQPVGDEQEKLALPEADPGLEGRILKLEMENAALRERLAELEHAALVERLAQLGPVLPGIDIEPVEPAFEPLDPALEPEEPFIDPDWPPAEVAPSRRARFRPRRALPADLERVIHPPIVVVREHPTRFRPFTKAAMDTHNARWSNPERAQSLTAQRRFFLNASKALGADLQSSEYRGVRLEVEKAMRRGELNARYAVQYLADVVDVFRTYERLERFGLVDSVAPPLSGDSFRQDPERMFRWASEVNEQKRKLR